MQAPLLDQHAVEARLSRELRRQLVHLGLEPEAVAHMTVERLIAVRRRTLRALIETPPARRA